MKADRILFGAACVGMGLLFHWAMNQTPDKKSFRQTQDTLLNDTDFRKPLLRDAFELSNPVKQDTVKMIKKVVK